MYIGVLNYFRRRFHPNISLFTSLLRAKGVPNKFFSKRAFSLGPFLSGECYLSAYLLLYQINNKPTAKISQQNPAPRQCRVILYDLLNLFYHYIHMIGYIWHRSHPGRTKFYFYTANMIKFE